MSDPGPDTSSLGDSTYYRSRLYQWLQIQVTAKRQPPPIGAEFPYVSRIDETRWGSPENTITQMGIIREIEEEEDAYSNYPNYRIVVEVEGELKKVGFYSESRYPSMTLANVEIQGKNCLFVLVIGEGYWYYGQNNSLVYGANHRSGWVQFEFSKREEALDILNAIRAFAEPCSECQVNEFCFCKSRMSAFEASRRIFDNFPSFMFDPESFTFSDEAQEKYKLKAVTKVASYGFPQDDSAASSSNRTSWADAPSVDMLSTGNRLTDLFENLESLRLSSHDLTQIGQIFADPRSLEIGYFGTFKHLLKELTNRYLEHQDDLDPALRGAVLEILALAYGRIEGYLSKGNFLPILNDALIPEHPWRFQPKPGLSRNYDLSFYFLSSLQGFGSGRYHPSLKTAQYLARKGLRLLKSLDARENKIDSLKFRLDLLNAADSDDQRSSRFPEYQILVPHIIFGESGIASRDRSGRKTIFSDPGIFYSDSFSYSLPNIVLENLTVELKKLIQEHASRLDGKNHHILYFAFKMCEAAEVEFSWTESKLVTLSKYRDQGIRVYVARYLEHEPSAVKKLALENVLFFLFALAKEPLQGVLDHCSNIQLDALADSISENRNGREASETEIFLIQYILNRGTTTFRAFRLISLMEDMQSPGKDDTWKETLDSYFSHSNFYHSDLVDEIKNFEFKTAKSEEFIGYFSSALARSLASYQYASVDELVSLLDAGKPELTSIFIRVLEKDVLSPRQMEELSEKYFNPDSMFAILKGAVASDNPSNLILLLQILSSEGTRSFWDLRGDDAEKLFQSWQGFGAVIWQNLDSLPGYALEKFANYKWFNFTVTKNLGSKELDNPSEAQEALLLAALAAEERIMESDSFTKALLLSPNRALNEAAIKYLRKTQSHDKFWLVMIESSLPTPRDEAKVYLHSQIDEDDFVSKLMMALDSNNKEARKCALEALREVEDPRKLIEITSKLTENRNSDTWMSVSRNIALVQESLALQKFTRTVFLTPRVGRREKNSVQVSVERLVRELSDVVEADTLMRMAFGSVSADREWALRQIALGKIKLDDVKVEQSWRPES